MVLISLTAAVFIYAFIISLLGPVAMEKEKLKEKMERISDTHSTRDRLEREKFKEPFAQRFIKPMFMSAAKKISGIFPKLNSEKMKEQLAVAGYSMDPITYNIVQFFVIMLSGIIIMLLAVSVKPGVLSGIVFFLVGMLFGMLLLKYAMQLKTRRRKELMSRQMPDVLDLLSVSVEAGLGFDAALLHVIENIRGPLTDEMMLAHREITLGRPRKEALAALGRRSGLESMVTFTTAIIQAEQRGLSLKHVLNIQAAQIRQQRRQEIEEKAMKAPVKIIIPLVLFIFPVILIVLLAPAVINIVSVLGGL